MSHYNTSEKILAIQIIEPLAVATKITTRIDKINANN